MWYFSFSYYSLQYRLWSFLSLPLEAPQECLHVCCPSNNFLPAFWTDAGAQVFLASFTDEMPVSTLEDSSGWSHLFQAHWALWNLRLAGCRGISLSFEFICFSGCPL